MKQFLTTFRFFAKPREILELLMQRYDIPLPEDLENNTDDIVKVCVTLTSFCELLIYELEIIRKRIKNACYLNDENVRKYLLKDVAIIL